MTYKPSYALKRKKIIVPLPEVLSFEAGTPVWVLQAVGAGEKRRIVKLEGIVIGPKVTKVCVRFRRFDGAWDTKGISVDKLERRG